MKVVNVTSADAPAGIVTRVLNEKIGSRTAPVVPDKSPLPSIAIGSRADLPRPMKFARAVSQLTNPSLEGTPGTTLAPERRAATTCPHHVGLSVAERGRRI